MTLFSFCARVLHSVAENLHTLRTRAAQVFRKPDVRVVKTNMTQLCLVVVCDCQRDPHKPDTKLKQLHESLQEIQPHAANAPGICEQAWLRFN